MPAVVDRLDRKGASVRPREDPAVEADDCGVFAMALQGLDGERRHLDHAPAALSLRRAAHRLRALYGEQVPGALRYPHRVGSDRETASVKVDIPPPECDQLTLAQPRGEHEHPQLVAFDGCSQATNNVAPCSAIHRSGSSNEESI